jgi:hypothetical protein
VVGLRSEQIQACLAEQQQVGGRLGEILRARGLITHEQILEVLRYQARWVATSMQADLKPHGLPYRAFLSMCMPAFNEECNIKDTLDAAIAILPEFVQRFEVIVVNDGSKDATAQIVSNYAELDGRVRLVNHETNCGYGAAVTSGLRAARGDLVAFTDSDGQFSFLDLPALLAQLQGSDAVIGYRFERADHWIRCFNAWGWNWLIRTVLGVKIRDLDCAFKLFRREVVDALQLTARGAGINAEIMAQCVHAGLRVEETPVTHYPRYYGAPTGAAFRVIARAFRELPGLWKYRRATPALIEAGLAYQQTKAQAAQSSPTPTPARPGRVLPAVMAVPARGEDRGSSHGSLAAGNGSHKSALPVPR